MNIDEYKKVENLNYEQYCKYLQNKYGATDQNYFTKNFNRNPKISRTKEGLYAHHIYENQYPNLSEANVAKQYPYECQLGKNIIYCDMLEHLFLHILISEQSSSNFNDSINGITLISDKLEELYNSDMELSDWEQICADKIINDEDVFEELKNRITQRSLLLEHNVSVYNELEEFLSYSNKVLVIIGTGGGKTSTALEYLRVHNCRALVLCPTNVIKDNWSTNKSVDAETYSYFRENYKNIDYTKYGAIIIDEAHHCSSDNVLGTALSWAMNNISNIKFIGLTAEEQRTDGKKVADDLFDGNLAEGINLLDGINNNIFYPFSYVGAYYNTSNLRKEYEHDPLYGELDLALNNTPTLKEILISNMPNNDRKGIIFVSNIEAIDEAISIMKDIFPDIEIRIIHSKQSKEENETNKNWFVNTNKGYLVSINMVSEGAHYPGVNTLIMFRHTESPLVFNQQLGRVVSLTKFPDPHAVVFDLVNNAVTAKFKTKHSETGNPIINILNEYNKIHKSKQIIISDYTTDIQNVLHKIYENNSDRWKPWEDDILKKYYPTGGTKECLKYLSNRTRQTVVSRAIKLKIKFIANRRTKKEINILRKYYPIGGVEECMKYLLNRTRQTIMSKASTLKIKYDYPNIWSEEEDNIIRKYYPISGTKECMKYLHKRTKETIGARAIFLNIKSENRFWSEEEDEILRKYYPTGGADECMKYLKIISKNQIMSRASKLKIKYENPNSWTENDDNIIRKYYPTGGAEECVKYLPNRTKKAIGAKAKKLKIKYENSNIWTENDDNIIRKYYPTGGADECMKYLPDRTIETILGRASKLKIKYIRTDLRSEKEDEILKKYYPTGGIKECMKYLPNKNKQSIQYKARKLKIKYNKNKIRKQREE